MYLDGKTKALSRQVVVTDYSKSNWKTTQRRIGIRKVILPPGGMKAYWDRRPALIQLSKSVGRSKAIKLCLDDFGGSQVGYCGMGFTENWKKPSVLQEVIAKDVGKSACNKKDLNLNTMVCLKDQGSPNIETQEDMGAPAYVMRNGQPYCLYGTVDSGDWKKFAYVNKIPYYYKWIKTHVRDLV